MTATATTKRDWKKVDSLVFEKEALPTGRVVKWVSDDREPLDINVERPFLDAVVKQFNKFKQVGVAVPLFNSHKQHADNKRGQVIDTPD
jgi:hypothetical protein